MKGYTIISFIKNNLPHKILKKNYRKKRYKFFEYKVTNPKPTQEFELYTIAFNNTFVIQKQIELCRKNLKDKFLHIIIDNSNNKKSSAEIKNICIKEDLMYVRLPKNPLWSSHSHALALNYVWEKIIKNRDCRYFGFLDHDIFPIHENTILDILKKQGLYGLMEDGNSLKFMKKSRILWPGFCFFDKNIYNNFDFSLVKSLFPLYAIDTGGGNYKIIYKNLNKSSFVFADRTKKQTINGHKYEYCHNDTWLHIGGAGYLNIESELIQLLN